MTAGRDSERRLDLIEGRFRGFALAAFWVLLFQVVCWIYSPALSGPFLYDDHVAIISNPDLREAARPWVVFGDHETSLHFDRRPVAGLITWLDYRLHGLNPQGYRFTNLFLHFAVGGALVGLILEAAPHFGCRYPRLLAHLVAALWLVHPIGTSAVSFVFQRSEQLMSLFYVLSIWALIYSPTTKWRNSVLGVSWILGCLSALSKEPGLTLIVALPLIDRIFLSSSWSEMWALRGRFHAGFAVTMIVIALWISTGARMLELEQPGIALNEPIPYFLYQCKVLLGYLGKVGWPYPLNFAPAPGSPVGWVPSFLILALIGSGVAWLGFRWRWLWVCLVISLCVLAPTSSFYPIPLEPEVVFRMYLPSACVLLCLVAGVGLLRYRFRYLIPVSGCVFGVAFVGLALACYERNKVYSSRIALWTDTVAQGPLNGKAWINLGLAELEEGNLSIARKCAQRASRLRNVPGAVVVDGAAAAYLEAMILLEEGEAGRADRVLSGLSGAAEKLPGYHVQRAKALAQLGRGEEARVLLRKHFPGWWRWNPEVGLVYVETLFREGRLEEAAEVIGDLKTEVPKALIEEEMARRFKDEEAGSAEPGTSVRDPNTE